MRSPVASVFGRKFLLFAASTLLIGGECVSAQDPVHWTAKASASSLAPGGRFDVVLSATVDEEWHVYSVTQGPGGPIPTTVAVGPKALFTRAGAIRGPAPVTAFDPNFEIKTETYDGAFTLTVPLTLASDARGGRATAHVEVGYQACTNRLCLPPTTVSLTVPVKWAGDASPQTPDATPQTPDAGLQTPDSRRPDARGQTPDAARK